MSDILELDKKWGLILRDPRTLSRFFRLHISITLWTGTGNSIRCPFHDDQNPSAHVHSDDDGDRLYCHTCGKQFSSYDYVIDVLQESPPRWVATHFQLDDILKAVEVFDM